MADPVVLAARNADFQDFIALLREQQPRKLDVVAPADKLRYSGGNLVISDVEQDISVDGVTAVDGVYRPTAVFEDGIAEKLKIPRQYLRRMRDSGRVDLIDENVNGWLHGGEQWDPARQDYNRWPGDDRSFLLRLFTGGGGPGPRTRSATDPGIGRALLSEHYRLTLDHLDVLTAALAGVEQADLHVEITNCDLTERRMRVRLNCLDVQMEAPGLLREYRSPFRVNPEAFRRAGIRSDRHGYIEESDRPVVYSGLDIDNSETGGGACIMTPFVGVLACFNGLVLTKQAMRRVHLGAKLESGVVKLQADTIRAQADLITKETRDTVKSWLNDGYLAAMVRGLEEKAGKPIHNAQEVLKTVTAKLAFTEAEQGSVFDHFIAGGQMTAGGVMQAVSSMAQTVDDPERSIELERQAIAAMEAAFAATA